MIIQLKDLQDNFNNLEAIKLKKSKTIRDLRAKVEALEKENFETLKQTKQTQAETLSELICNDCDYKAFKDSERSLHMENVHVRSQ